MAAAVAALALAATSALAQRRETVVAGAHYRAGWFHRLMLGAHYRDLWTTPIDVPVLDLDRFAGGLTPDRCGGGYQTKSLRFRGADRREYVFRSVDKDPVMVLAPELRRTFARQIVQDQISAAHPGAPLIVAPLLEAVGVLHAKPQLVLLPNDSRIAGLECGRPGTLGMIEERPAEGDDDSPGFAGAADLASTVRLFDRLENGADHRVDARAFLAARLMDVFMGDWDRHQDQWRWARFDSAGVHWWRPIPRDRDYAFAHLDGFLVWIAGFYKPQIIGFGDEYPRIWRITYSGRVVDRRLLTGLERTTWDSVARAVQVRVTDSVIDAAVRALPPAYFAKNGPALIRALRRRRDGIPEMAARYYALLAGFPDVHATDRRDVAEVVRGPDARVTIRLSRPGSAPYYERTFERSETREIRLYLHGGDDRLVARDSGSAGASRPVVRVIGGHGDDDFADSSRAGIRIYDDAGQNRAARGPRTAFDGSRYVPPAGDTVSLAPPRDWGSRWVPLVWSSYAPDVGAFLGGGAMRTGYGFRRFPYSSRIQIRAGYATTAATGRAEFNGEFRDPLFPAILSLRARASGIEVIHFYGLGNETPDTGSREFYKVRHQEYLAAPALTFLLAPTAHVSIGPLFKFTRTRLEAGTFIEATRPYGVTEFGQIGAAADLRLDTRDTAAAATRGLTLRLGGSYFPRALDVAAAFGEGHAEATSHLTADIPLQPTLALRASGRKNWGPYPYHEAAFLGGWNSVRGLPEQRFAGDAAVFGNAELRLSLAPVFVVLPARFGVFGLYDVGRVYRRGETSDRWHGGAGGGIWLAFLHRANTMSLAAADAGDGVRLYARAGFAF
jgi:hypothetical protein